MEDTALNRFLSDVNTCCVFLGNLGMVLKKVSKPAKNRFFGTHFIMKFHEETMSHESFLRQCGSATKRATKIRHKCHGRPKTSGVDGQQKNCSNG